MAIEIIPKKEAEVPSWQNILFYILIFLLLVSISVYFILDYYFIKKADQKLQNLNETIEKARSPQRIALEKEIINYKEKIDNFGSLILQHQRTSNFFDSLEKITHPNVFFSDINLEVRRNSVELSGETESFQSLGQQLFIFRKTEFIKSFTISNIKIGKEGEIQLTFNLSLDPNVFK